jgi:hypothetical protein
MTAIALKYTDVPETAELKPAPARRREGGLLAHLRPDFELPSHWWNLPEVDGEMGLADK